MKLSELTAGLEILSSNVPAELEITGVAYDSRKVEEGNLFVAITGFASDGNKFIPMAIAKGAKVILTDRKPLEETPFILVPSARKALAVLGINWFGHPADHLNMVGVTGTNGKTSSTLLLKSVLEALGHGPVGLIGTIQNMIGQEVLPTERTTPESFELQALLAQMVEKGCKYVVMEVSSHALSLDRVAGIHFKAAAFTNLTEDHLDFHGTMEAYAEAKSILFTRCDTGVFNADDPTASYMMEKCGGTCITVSQQTETADLYAENAELGADHVAFTLRNGEEKLPVRLGIPGLFTVSNALTVLGLSKALGLDLKEAAEALYHAKGIPGRIEVVPTPGTDFTVLIDYAHTPDGLESILRSVRGFCKGRLIAVFGCGGDRDRSKRPIMGEIGVRLADYVVFTSDNPRTEDPDAIIRDIIAGASGTNTPYIVISDRRKAIAESLSMARADDIIVLAGKGHETYQEINHVKRHLDEREEVASWLQKREGQK